MQASEGERTRERELDVEEGRVGIAGALFLSLRRGREGGRVKKSSVV